MKDVIIPALGESITSGIIAAWHVSDGDLVEEGQVLFELETDKASLPVPSSADGVIKEILIITGDEVKIVQVVMKIYGAASGGETPAKASSPEPSKQKERID